MYLHTYRDTLSHKAHTFSAVSQMYRSCNLLCQKQCVEAVPLLQIVTLAVAVHGESSYVEIWPMKGFVR